MRSRDTRICNTRPHKLWLRQRDRMHAGSPVRREKLRDYTSVIGKKTEKQ